jgi:hypothetical protein
MSDGRRERVKGTHLGDDYRPKLGIRHVAIVWGVAFAAKMESLSRHRVVSPRRLLNSSPSRQLDDLTVDLGLCTFCVSDSSSMGDRDEPIAPVRIRSPFRFLTSQRVPSRLPSTARCTETLTSHRNSPYKTGQITLGRGRRDDSLDPCSHLMHRRDAVVLEDA